MMGKKKTLRRLTTLYVVFFVVILVSGVLSFSGVFGEGFKTGRNDASRLFKAAGPDNNVGIFYEMNVATSSLDFDMPIYNDPDDMLIKARPATLDIMSVSSQGNKLKGSGWATFFSLLSAAAYIAIFVVIFVILSSLRKSVLRGNVFDRRNVALTRVIGGLLIAASLLLSLSVWLESRALAPFFVDASVKIYTAFPFHVGEIIMGVMILVVAEIFVIGYSLSEEQKLTI